MFEDLLAFIQKRLFWLIVAAIGFGLAVVYLTGGIAFTPLICLLAALLMIYPSLVPLDFRKVKAVGNNKKVIAVSLVANFLISPLLATLIGWLLLPQEPSLRLGLILLAILPGGGMVTTWAYKSKADMPLTVGIVFANLLVAIVLAPFYLSLAMGALALPDRQAVSETCVVSAASQGAFGCAFAGQGGISPLKIALPIIIIIIVPLILAYYTQRHILNKVGQQGFEAVKGKFAAFSNLGLLVVLAVLMSVKENGIIFYRPDILPKAAIAIVLYYALTLAYAWRLGSLKPGEKGRALVWGTYLRYVTLALGLAISMVYQDPAYSPAVVIIVIAYLVQIPSSFWLAAKYNN
jgi:ACR3 family arsenite efflux pump ArsB